MNEDSMDRVLLDWARERPDIDASGLGITSRILLLAKHLAKEDKRVLARVGLEPWMLEVLGALRRQGPPYQMSPTHLRRMVLLSSGAMTNRLDRLEAVGLVERSQDPADRRGLLVTLTEKGRGLADRGFEARVKHIERLLLPLAPDRRAQAVEELRSLMISIADPAA